MKITADRLLRLLMHKHRDDVCVPEAPAGRGRVDLWTMKRSWASPDIRSYEIKVSRSDFLQDDKWQGYMSCCHSFWFVTPQGVIKPDEIPAEAGHILVSKTGTKLYTKKKAPAHSKLDEKVLSKLMMSVLFSRSRIIGSYFGGQPKTDEEKIREWLETKEEKRHLGAVYSKHLNEQVQRTIDKATIEAAEAIQENRVLQPVKAALEAMGFESPYRQLGFRPMDKIANAMKVIPPGFSASLDQLLSQLEGMKLRIKELQDAKTDQTDV